MLVKQKMHKKIEYFEIINECDDCVEELPKGVLRSDETRFCPLCDALVLSYDDADCVEEAILLVKSLKYKKQKKSKFV